MYIPAGASSIGCSCVGLSPDDGGGGGGGGGWFSSDPNTLHHIHNRCYMIERL